MKLWEYLCQGGPVMIPLLGVSILIWWIGIRLWLWPRSSGSALRLTSGNGMKPRNTLRVLRTLTGVAPYLGLLGTVGGMMMAFEGLLQYGPGSLRGLSGGIARALVTTQAGLLVALCGLLLLVFLESRITRMESTPAAGRGGRGRGHRPGRRWRHG